MIITNKYKLDDLVVKSVQSDYKYKDRQYSVTSILTDYKDVLLKRRHNDEIVKDVSSMAWMMFGTAFHEFMEKQEVQWEEVPEPIYKAFSQFSLDSKEEWELGDEKDPLNMKPKFYIKPKLKEQHLVYKCKNSDYTLTGYSDLYNLLTNEVVDYKTASVNKVLYADWDDYKKQLKLYAVMLQSMGYPCHKGRLIVFLKDWSQTQFQRDPKNYPSSPIYQIGWEFTWEDLAQEKQWIEDYFMKLETIEELDDDSINECDLSVRTFGRKPTYAIMKNANVRAVKVCDTLQEANEYIRYNKLDLSKDNYWIKERQAEDVRCKNYCDSCHWCSHFIENYATAILMDTTEHKVVMGFKDKWEANEYIEALPQYQDEKYKLLVKENKEND